MLVIRNNTYSQSCLWGHRKSNANNPFSYKKALFNETSDKSLYYSNYNISKTFDDGVSVIVNTLSDSVAVLSKEETKLFNSISLRSDNSVFDDQLLDLGFITFDKKNEEELLSLQKNLILSNHMGLPSVTILPTQACNARCAYCFAEHNTKISMTNETTEKVIKFFSDTFKPQDHVLIRWFGGEPLMAKETITYITSRIDEVFDHKLDFESLLFTNGSLITDELLFEAKNIWRVSKIQLTLDGFNEEHNNRKRYAGENADYYNKVLSDISKILSLGIRVDCRINLDKDNINQIDNILSDLERFKDNSLFRARLTILRPSDCGANSFNYIKPSDLSWAYNILYRKAFSKGFIKDINSIIPARRDECCIARSINKVIIGADGYFYKCLQEVFDANHAVGSLDESINLLKYYNYCNTELHSECSACKFLPVCEGGCEAYWNMRDNYDISPCIREKFFFDLLLDFVYEWFIHGRLMSLEESVVDSSFQMEC
jgi:uncharacterized protein